MSIAEQKTESAFTAESTGKFVQTKKWRIHYKEAGKGHPVILLHGSGPGASGWSNFSSNFAALAAKYRLILMDFPGWGKSDELDTNIHPRWISNAEAIKLLMDELAIEKAALVGNSMGGMAAQMFTSLYEDRVTHCVTMGSPSPAAPQHFFSPGGPSEGMKVLIRAYKEPSPENFRKLVNIMVFDDSFASDELIKERCENALANPNHLRNFLAGLRSYNLQSPEDLAVAGRLSKAKTPALIIHGRDDRVVNVEHSLRTAAMMNNSTLLVFNRCGHWAQLEHAAQFNRLLEAFISSTSAAH